MRMIAVTVRYYNVIRDAAGTREEQRLYPAGATLLDLLQDVAHTYPALAGLLFLADGTLSPYTRFFVNGAAVEPGKVDCPLQAGDQIMLFPAVAGG